MNDTHDRRWVVLQHDPAGNGEPPFPPTRTLPELLSFGVVPVDKPAGPTSHDIVSRTKRVLRVPKAGHGGTLDPNATGVLPVFLGRATRLSGLLLRSGKAYDAVARFHGPVTQEAVESLAAEFVGEIRQLPPVRSRVKRAWRTRAVYTLEVLSVEGRDARLRTDVEAGTYIRKLIHDMGETLGTGAHMTGLRRTRAGPFREEAAVTLEVLAEARAHAEGGDASALREAVRPGEVLCTPLPRLVVDEGAARALARGAPLAAPGILRFEAPLATGDEVAVLDASGEWVALGNSLVDGETLGPGARGWTVKTRKVFRPAAPSA
jgi:H/ACA ribonucleoprotein complex subunit 4